MRPYEATWTLDVRRADDETWHPLRKQTADEVLAFLAETLDGQPHNWAEVRRIRRETEGASS